MFEYLIANLIYFVVLDTTNFHIICNKKIKFTSLHLFYGPLQIP